MCSQASATSVAQSSACCIGHRPSWSPMRLTEYGLQSFSKATGRRAAIPCGNGPTNSEQNFLSHVGCICFLQPQFLDDAGDYRFVYLRGFQPRFAIAVSMENSPIRNEATWNSGPRQSSRRGNDIQKCGGIEFPRLPKTTTSSPEEGRSSQRLNKSS